MSSILIRCVARLPGAADGRLSTANQPLAREYHKTLQSASLFSLFFTHCGDLRQLLQAVVARASEAAGLGAVVEEREGAVGRGEGIAEVAPGRGREGGSPLRLELAVGWGQPLETHAVGVRSAERR